VLEIFLFNLQEGFTFNLHCVSNFCEWNLFFPDCCQFNDYYCPLHHVILFTM